MLGFSPISGGPLSAVSPPAAMLPGVFGVLGTVGCTTGCACGNCIQRFIPYVCGSLGCFVVGSLVSVYTSLGGMLIASGTTGSLGTVTLNIGVTGSYYITATAPGYPDYGGTATLVCGGSTALGFPALTGGFPGVSTCCTCCSLLLAAPPWPTLVPMYLTDINGTYQLSVAIDGIGLFLYCYAPVSMASVVLSQGSGVCSIGAGSANIYYVIRCAVVGGAGALSVARNWYMAWCCTPATNICDVATRSSAILYAAITATSCQQGVSGITSVPSACGNSFSWSGTPVTSGSPSLPDPVGGSVAITA
jgi:hypothetical protein